MRKRCSYLHPNGKPCRRWPSAGSPFCYHHTPHPDVRTPTEGEDLHPLLRLTTPGDVFDVVRETLNAARLGRIRPSQVYAVGYMAHVWHHFFKLQNFHSRDAGLYRQMNPDLVDEEEISGDARTPVAELAALPDLPDEPEVTTAKPSVKKSA